MKKTILAIFAAVFAFASTAAQVKKPASQLRIYINPGHGSWTMNDRPMALIDHPSYYLANGDVDTLRFFESNTNLNKCFGVMEKLIEYGVPFDRSLNQSNAVAYRVGAALDLRQNIVFSRVKSGPFPVPDPKANYDGYYNRSLSEIAQEVESNNFDMFLSVHSNGNNTGANTTENYLLMLFRGPDGSPCVPGSDAMAAQGWKYAIANTLQQWSRGSATSTIIRGDWSFYGDHGVSTNGCDGYLGVLKHNVPGYLAEGYFHTYAPGRHRAMNPDVCADEGVCYARGIADYFGLTKETTGDILGIVHDKNRRINEPNYNNCSGNDIYYPVNGCKVTLKKSGNVVATYTTDNRYNGAFYFPHLQPGKYTLAFSHNDYYDLEHEVEVEVKAATTAYPSVLLYNKNYEAEPEPEEQTRAAFAYNLSATAADESYRITFYASAQAPKAILHAHTADADRTIELGEATSGYNSFTIAKDALPSGSCTWEIELESAPATNAYLVYKETASGVSGTSRGGLVMINDPSSKLFGRIFVAYGGTGRIAEYDPRFRVQCNYSANWQKSSNGFTPGRLTYANGKIFCSDFSDANSGIYVLDLAAGASAFTSLFDTSTRNSSGQMTAGGRAVGGSTSHVAFRGTGDDAVMWLFPEDYPNSGSGTNADHMLYGWKIGNRNTITGQHDYSLPKNGLANTWQYLIPTEGGMWVSQYRSQGNNTSDYPGIVYIDWQGRKLYSSHVLAGGTMDFVSGSIAISDDGSQMVVDQGLAGLHVYKITWSGNTPTLVHDYKIPDSESTYDSYNYPQMQFDPVGNLVVFARGEGVKIFAMPSSDRRFTTPAPATSVLQGTGAGIDDVLDDSTVPVVYYNLQGLRVQNPENGIFIEIRGNKARKVLKQ